MAYQLQKVTSADQEKIIVDCSNNRYLKHLFELVMKTNRFPEVWAIDKQQNSYLISEPQIGRPEIDGRPYMFFYGGSPFRIASERPTGNKFYFSEKYEISFDEMKNIKDQAALAFGVFGRYGMGELNQNGKPEFRVVPDFTDNF